MKRTIIITVMLALMLPMAVWAQCANCPSKGDKEMKAEQPVYKTLAGYNKPNPLPDGKYFTYSFVKKPKMGATILKVSIFDKQKRLSDDYTVYASADMPSMKGAHSTGYTKMKPNKKGELLIPINFVMPGVWQVDLKLVKEGGKTEYGSFQLKI